MVDLLVFLVWEPFWFMGVWLEASFEGIEAYIGMKGVIVYLDGVGFAIWWGELQILSEYLLIEIWFFRALKTHDPASME